MNLKITDDTVKVITYNGNNSAELWYKDKTMSDIALVWPKTAPSTIKYSITDIDYPSSIEYSATSATVFYTCNTIEVNSKTGAETIISSETKADVVGPFEVNESTTDRKLNSDIIYWQTESFTWNIYQEVKGTVIITNSDYVTITYTWTEGNDIDQNVSLLPSQAAIVESDYTGDKGFIGFNGNSGRTIGYSALTWGGDNQGKGSEANLINVANAVKYKYISALTENNFSYLCFPIKAYYYGQKSLEYLGSKLTLQIKAYSGGTISQSGFTFVNSGGTEIQLENSGFTSTVNAYGPPTKNHQLYGFIYIDLGNGVITLNSVDAFHSPYKNNPVVSSTPTYSDLQLHKYNQTFSWIMNDSSYTAMTDATYKMTYTYQNGNEEAFMCDSAIYDSITDWKNTYIKTYDNIQITKYFTLYGFNEPYTFTRTGGTEGNSVIITLNDGFIKKLNNVRATKDLFNSSTKIVKVELSDSAASIDDSAFYNCTSLSSVTIGSSVTSIGDYAFYNCTSLSSVTIGSSVTSIGAYAFSNCTSLTSVTIPNSVISIGMYAFQSCSGLTSVTIPDSVTSIKICAFYNCSSLSSVTIGSSVTSIGDYAFQSCSSLSSVTIGSSVTSIGAYAFSNCTSLTSVTIPNSVTSIEDRAFQSCSSLSTITYNGTVAQWNAITKGTDWHYNVPSTTVVTCTDGTVALD